MYLSEGEGTVQITLFEKYKVVDVVYESDTTAVYLVEHLSMLSRRIIKKILKKSINQSSFYSEINILKTIRHPSIPVIYDIEEDVSAYYIVEEYMEGINLYEYVLEKGTLSLEEASFIGCKICEIVNYLHSHKPIPILFLDIQPKNILINNDKVYLVDFGSSYYADESDKRRFLFGTVGYAAPEQYRYERLDQRTDIYGIGAVLYFMITGQPCEHKGTKSLKFPNNISGKYKMIVLQCLCADSEVRFVSASVIEKNLQEILSKDNTYSNENKPLNIYIVGAQSRVGTTHISLALASYLASIGKLVVYEECNDSNHLRLLAKERKLDYKGGFFREGALLLKPEYGPQVKLQVSADVLIKDCTGVEASDINPNDIILLILGAKPWELDNSIKKYTELLEVKESVGCKLIVLSNLSSKGKSLALWKSIESVGLEIPYMGDVFVEGDIEKEFFQGLMKELGYSQGGELNKKKTRLFRRASKKAKNNSNRSNGSS